jgi:hypothetical protein
VESIAHGGTSTITTVGQRSSFARRFWLNGNYEITLFLQTELRVRSGILCKLSFGTLQAAPNLGFASIEAAAQIYAGTREAVEAVLTDRCD